MTVEEIKQDWNEMAYDKYAHEVPLKKGADRLLKQLRGQGIRIGIASSNSHELINASLDANGVRQYFDCIRTACDVAKGKPAPDIYLSVAESLGTAPADCLVFEDVPMGILAGRSAGMKVCAVADKSAEDQTEKIREMADYYIRTFEDVLNHTYETLI